MTQRLKLVFVFSHSGSNLLVVSYNINVVLNLYFKTMSQYLTTLSNWGPHTLVVGSSQ